MSETIIEEGGPSEAVSTADLERMLEEARTEKESYKRRLDEVEGQRRHAYRERDEATAAVLSESQRRFNAEAESVASAIAAATTDADRAEAEYVRAMEAQDYGAAGKAQRAIAEAAARHNNLDSKRQFLEANKERLIRTSEPARTPPPQDTGDRYAGIVQDLLPAERQWLDARPKFLDDTKFRARVIGASQFAAADHPRGTPEYFREIERILGETAAAPEERAAPARQERGASADVSPQRRAAPGTAPQGSREVRLTADQAEVADSLYGNPSSPDYIADPGERYKKYSGNLERMRASGRM